MRLIATLLMFALVSFAAARASTLGAYATLEAASAADCVKLCQDDSLCIGSTYEAGLCGLWASVPQNPPTHFALSERAQRFARSIPSAAAAPEPNGPQHPTPAEPEPAAVALLGGDSRIQDLRPAFGDR